MTPTLRVLALAGAVCLTASQAMAQDRPTVGAVDATQAEVLAAHDGTSRDLSAGSDLIFEDVVLTGAGARLQATLADGAAVTLGENAELVIDEFVYDPGSTGGSIRASVSGAFLFVGGEIDGDVGRIQIETPVATLGVRGTTVWGGPVTGGFGVLLREGRVTVTTPSGTVVLDEPGEGTLITAPNSSPGEPVSWSQERVDEALASISFDQ